VTHVMIVEDDPNGHHLTYVRYLADAALIEGSRVTLLTTEQVRASKEYAQQIGPLEDRLTVLAEEEIATPKQLRVAAARIGPDRTIVPHGDQLAIRLGVWPRWGGPGVLVPLLMRDPRQQRIGGEHAGRRALKRLLVFGARHAPGVIVVALRSALHTPGAGELVAVDPVEIDVQPDVVDRCRQLWGVGDDVFWFAIIGAITRRKNVGMVIRALDALAAAERTTRLGLMIVGPEDDSARRESDHALADRPGGLTSIARVDRLLEDDELDAAVQMADCVVLAHSNEGPSGILAKAVARGAIIAAAGARSLQQDTALLPAAAWSELSVEAMTTMFATCVHMPKPAPRTDLGSDQFCQILLHGTR
jgi:hypothetical protein